MPLHDAVEIYFKKFATTENQRRYQVYGLRGIGLMIVCVLSDLTRLNLLGGGRKSWYIILLLCLNNRGVIVALIY